MIYSVSSYVKNTSRLLIIYPDYSQFFCQVCMIFQKHVYTLDYISRLFSVFLSSLYDIEVWLHCMHQALHDDLIVYT